MKGLLIGGTSHCGKSSLARSVGEALGWRVVSTDSLARHPGRPWLGVPQAVEEFYETLSEETIYWFLRVHHTNMWPLLSSVIAREGAAGGGFVLEGSALRPERLVTIGDPEVLAVCLTAAPDVLVDRMKRESGYTDRDARQRGLIDRFIARSLRDDEDLCAEARDTGVWLLDTSEIGGIGAVTEQVLHRLTPS